MMNSFLLRGVFACNSRTENAVQLPGREHCVLVLILTGTLHATLLTSLFQRDVFDVVFPHIDLCWAKESIVGKLL